MPSLHGYLIIVYGPSGSGKNSLIDALGQKLLALGISAIQISEEELDDKRQEILIARERGISSGGSGDRQMAEVLIDHRHDIYRKNVEPSLIKGNFVIANRGEPATLAYQTARGEITMTDVWNQHREKGVPTPDLVVITTCSAETSLKREEADRKVSAVRRESESGRGLSGKVSTEIGASEPDKFERREMIHKQFEITKVFLEGKGINVLYLNTENTSVSEEIHEVLRFLDI